MAVSSPVPFSYNSVHIIFGRFDSQLKNRTQSEAWKSYLEFSNDLKK